MGNGNRKVVRESVLTPSSSSFGAAVLGVPIVPHTDLSVGLLTKSDSLLSPISRLGCLLLQILVAVNECRSGPMVSQDSSVHD